MGEKLRILIVDDDEMIVRTAVDILTVKGHQAEGAFSGSAALEKVEQTHFDCVMTDIKMPGMNGVEFFKAVKATQPDLPVVLMTAYAADSLVKEGSEEGVIATLTKPFDINVLLSFLSSLRKEHSMVIVDDDPLFCKTLGDVLRVRHFKVTTVTDASSVMEALSPDGQVVLLDMKLNHVSGLDVLKQIRDKFPRLPVILVTGYGKEMTSLIEAALEINAYACLYKPFEIEELLQLLTEVRRQELSRALGQPVRKRGVTNK